MPRFCFSSPLPLYSVWHCSDTISTITSGVCVCLCVRPLTDGMEEGRRRLRGREKKNEGFNSLPTSVYLEKKPLCHSVILTAYTRANVSPTMTAF